MNIEIDKNIQKQAKKYSFDIKKTLKAATNNIPKASQQQIDSIRIKCGIIGAPSIKYDKKKELLEINIFPRFFGAFYSKNQSKTVRNKAVEYIFSHEILEALDNNTSSIKGFFNNIIVSFQSTLFHPSLGFVPSEEAINLCCNDLLSDIKTDEKLLKRKKLREGFLAAHSPLYTMDEYYLRKIDVKKIGEEYISPTSPEEILFLGLSSLRRTILSEQIDDKRLKNRIQRFRSQTYHRFPKKIKSPKAIEQFFNIRNELRKLEPSENRLLNYMNDFTNSIKNLEDGLNG